MQSKINQLLSKGIHKGLFFNKWLQENGYSNQLIKHYKSSNWIESLHKGIYYRKGELLDPYACLQSYNTQLNNFCRIGGHSALALYGFYHYASVGYSKIYLFDKENIRPNWINCKEFKNIFSFFSTETFSNINEVKYSFNGYQVLISSPELAFAECLLLSIKHYNLIDLYYIMETLTNLNPQKVVDVLNNTNNYRIRRLYLYMAEKANHDWFNMIDVSKIDIGKNKQQLCQGGVYVGKYKMTIPKELYDYE